MRKEGSKKQQNNQEGQGSKGPGPPSTILVLNEVVIDRGPSPYLSNIDLFLDGKHITSVQGDGKYEFIRFFITVFDCFVKIYVDIYYIYYLFCN